MVSEPPAGIVADREPWGIELPRSRADSWRQRPAVEGALWVRRLCGFGTEGRAAAPPSCLTTRHRAPPGESRSAEILQEFAHADAHLQGDW